jgi:hypothetical protein
MEGMGKHASPSALLNRALELRKQGFYAVNQRQNQEQSQRWLATMGLQNGAFSDFVSWRRQDLTVGCHRVGGSNFNWLQLHCGANQKA